VAWEHLNLAFDLQLLAALFRQTFSQIASKSGVELPELLRAEQIAAGALGLREKREASARGGGHSIAGVHVADAGV